MKRSAGLLLYGRVDGRPRGAARSPRWAVLGATRRRCSLPKGEYEAGEDPLEVARREFAEGLGAGLLQDPVTALGETRQPDGKIVIAWA